MKIVSQMRILDEELEDRRMVEKMVVSFPARFEQKICSLEDTKGLKRISVSNFVNALHIVELRQNMRGGGGAEAALFSQHISKIQSAQPVDKPAATAKNSRRVAGSNRQQMQGTRQHLLQQGQGSQGTTSPLSTLFQGHSLGQILLVPTKCPMSNLPSIWACSESV